MDILQLLTIAVAYFALQYVGIRFLSGAWHTAAVMTAPLLATLVCFGVIGVQLGIPGAGLTLQMVLPLGIAYLTLLLATRFVAQVFQQKQS